MAGIYEIIAKKRDGGVLTPQEISFFVKGVTDGSILDYQVSALLMAIFLRGLHKGEMSFFSRPGVGTRVVLTFPPCREEDEK